MFQDGNKCHIKHIFTINKGLLCFIPGFIRSKGESEYQSLPRTKPHHPSSCPIILHLSQSFYIIYSWQGCGRAGGAHERSDTAVAR
jgi:hypothetical protein